MKLLIKMLVFRVIKKEPVPTMDFQVWSILITLLFGSLLKVQSLLKKRKMLNKLLLNLLNENGINGLVGKQFLVSFGGVDGN